MCPGEGAESRPLERPWAAQTARGVGALTEVAAGRAGRRARVAGREERLVRGRREGQLGSVAERHRVAVEDEARAAALLAAALGERRPPEVGARGGEAGAPARVRVQVQVAGLHGEPARPLQLPGLRGLRRERGVRLGHALLAGPARVLLEEGRPGRRRAGRRGGHVGVGREVPVRRGERGAHVQPRVWPQTEVRGAEEVRPRHRELQPDPRGHRRAPRHLWGRGGRRGLSGVPAGPSVFCCVCRALGSVLGAWEETGAAPALPLGEHNMKQHLLDSYLVPPPPPRDVGSWKGAPQLTEQAESPPCGVDNGSGR